LLNLLFSHDGAPLGSLRLYSLVVHFWDQVVKVVRIIDFLVAGWCVQIRLCFDHARAHLRELIAASVVFDIEAHEAVLVQRLLTSFLSDRTRDQLHFVLFQHLVLDLLLLLDLLALAQHLLPVSLDLLSELVTPVPL